MSVLWVRQGERIGTLNGQLVRVIDPDEPLPESYVKVKNLFPDREWSVFEPISIEQLIDENERLKKQLANETSS